MNIFDHEFGDFKMVNLENFFEDIQRGAMDSGYDLFLTHGIDGMKKEMVWLMPWDKELKLIEEYNTTCQTK